MVMSRRGGRREEEEREARRVERGSAREADDCVIMTAAFG